MMEIATITVYNVDSASKVSKEGANIKFFKRNQENTPRPEELPLRFEIAPHHSHQYSSFRSDLAAAALN